MTLALRNRVTAHALGHILEDVAREVGECIDSGAKSMEAIKAECWRNSEIIKQRERFLGVIIDHLRSPLLHTSLTLDAFLSGGCGRLESQQADILSELKSSNDSLLRMIDSLEDTFNFESYKDAGFSAEG